MARKSRKKEVVRCRSWRAHDGKRYVCQEPQGHEGVCIDGLGRRMKQTYLVDYIAKKESTTS